MATELRCPDGETVAKWSPLLCQLITFTVDLTVILIKTPSSSSFVPGRAHLAGGSLPAGRACCPFVAYPKPAARMSRLVWSRVGVTLAWAGTMRKISSPAAAARINASLVGLHRTVLTGSSLLSLTDHTWRPVNSSQTRTVPSSPPVASAMPVYNRSQCQYSPNSGSKTYRINCHASYPTFVAAENSLDNGREGLELGRRGQLRKQRIRVDIKSVLPDARCQIEVLLIRTSVQHILANVADSLTMQRSNRSLTKVPQAGTFRKALYFCGRYSFSLSSGSAFSHSSRSSLDLETVNVSSRPIRRLGRHTADIPRAGCS